MRRMNLWRLVGVLFLGSGFAAAPSAAQDVAGLTFDVRITTGDSTAGSHQTGKGWMAGRRTRLDLSGGMPGGAIPGMSGGDVSIITHDSGGTQTFALVMHEQKKFMYPSRMMEQLREMMASLAEKPKMTFAVANIVVDTLGPGETISGFSTKRYKVRADISMTIEMMGEIVDESMHVESEGDYAEELADFSDPLKDTRGIQAMAAGMPWMDSTANAEMEKLVRAAPRGLALRQVDRVTGVTEDGAAPPVTTTRLSNIIRATFSSSVFAMPEGYTEMEMPMMPP
ncbi:MAG TPA: hypothetical protein VMY38_08935, partial [Gemmatimonadaceae bacterium]|nr:hypothetical protein [Gemmatimonadaceae bacterium]